MVPPLYLGWQYACVCRDSLTLRMAVEGTGQSGRRVRHLHGQGMGQAGGPTDLRHPAQLHSCPLPGLPAHLAEKPTGFPTGCHQVSVTERPAGRDRCVGWRLACGLLTILSLSISLPHRACPQCRVHSSYIIPHKFWVSKGAEKEQLIRNFKAWTR